MEYARFGVLTALIIIIIIIPIIWDMTLCKLTLQHY